VSWVRIDDRAPEHRKQLAAGAVASWLWVCGLAYANRQPARDGFVPAAVLPMLYPIPGVTKQAARLVDAGLWERVEGGFQIHDYLDFQPSRAEVEQASARKAEAGRRGGLKSGEARRSKSEAAAQGNAKHGASPVASPRPNPDPDPDPDPDPIPIPSHPVPSESAPSALRLTPPTNGSRKASRKKPKTAAPARTESAESIDAWCAKWGIPSPTFDAEAKRFLNHARANERLAGDWTSAWENWLEKAKEYTRPARNNGHQAPPAGGSQWDSALDDAPDTTTARALVKQEQHETTPPRWVVEQERRRARHTPQHALAGDLTPPAYLADENELQEKEPAEGGGT
jgi:hypothetical protein